MARCFARVSAVILALSVLQECSSKRVDIGMTAQKMMANESDFDEMLMNEVQMREVPVRGGTKIKLMSLNVEFFTEMCDKGFTKGIDYCTTTTDTTCEEEKTQKLCCNMPGSPLKDACQEKKCYDRGALESVTWPSYETGTRGDQPPSEPKCLQGARGLLEDVVKKFQPHVVATQEDFENYPLRVENYVTIISANSHAQWYQVPDPTDANPKRLRTKSLLQGGQPVHMVNALLVHKDYFNLAESTKICQRPGHVFEPIVDGQFYRCGLDLISPAVAAKKKQILAEHITGWKNDDVVGSPTHMTTIPRDIPDDTGQDQILLMASRCAALAAVGETGKHIVVASTHLTGGRFDDDLIGLPPQHADIEALQRDEKKKQVKKLMQSLSTVNAPSIIMGDFNGPDDFDIQWWKVLTAPWPATHPGLMSIFKPQEKAKKVFDRIRALVNEDQGKLPFFHTDHHSKGGMLGKAVNLFGAGKYVSDSVWVTDPTLKGLVSKAEFAQIAKFEASYKEWMVGMHGFLRAHKWTPLITSTDFTVPFGINQGTTSKYGGVIDFFYVSPGVLEPNAPCEGTEPKNVDFSNMPNLGSVPDAEHVKSCKGKRVEWEVTVANGVLKRSTDHAPVIVELSIK